MEKQFKTFKKFLKVLGFSTNHFSSIIIDENRIVAIFAPNIFDEVCEINEQFILKLDTKTTFKFESSNIQFKWHMPVMSL